MTLLEITGRPFFLDVYRLFFDFKNARRKANASFTQIVSTTWQYFHRPLLSLK